MLLRLLKNIFIFAINQIHTGMKHTILILIMALLPMAVTAQQKKQRYVSNMMHTIVYLHGDSTGEGYLRNVPEVYDEQLRLVPLNMKLFSKDQVYDINKIDSMKSWFDEEPYMITHWERAYVNMAFGNNTPMVSEHPALLMQVYDGKSIRAYLAYNRLVGMRVVYQSCAMDTAKALFNEGSRLTDKRKKTLSEEFAAYPQLVKYINNMEKDVLKTRPGLLLREIDSQLTWGVKADRQRP